MLNCKNLEPRGKKMQICGACFSSFIKLKNKPGKYFANEVIWKKVNFQVCKIYLVCMFAKNIKLKRDLFMIAEHSQTNIRPNKKKAQTVLAQV